MYSLNIPHSDQNPDFSDISLQRNDIAIGKEFWRFFFVWFYHDSTRWNMIVHELFANEP